MPPTTPLTLNTFSIVARDRASGMFGVAASTRLPAVGVLVPYARAGVGAIATQARTNPLLGYDGLDLLQRGYDAEETLKILLGSDPEPEKRQVGIVDSQGRSAAHTGAEADPWRGHVTGDGYAVTGNLVAGEEVVLAMAAAFEASEGEILPERLGGREGARRRLASASRPPDHTPRKLKKLRGRSFLPLLVYLPRGEVLVLYAFRLRSRIATMRTPSTDTVRSITNLARNRLRRISRASPSC